MKSKILYYFLIILSIVLFVLSISVFNNTKFMAPILIVMSVYLFLGTVIKLFKTDNKSKNIILSILDFLFWLP